MNDYPRLSGGIFLMLILQALPQRTGSRQRCEGVSDGLSDADVLKGLIRVIDSSYQDIKPASMKSLVNGYKSCTRSTGESLPFNDEVKIGCFDNTVKNQYKFVKNKMDKFVVKFINLGDGGGKYKLLVGALIDLIQNDKTIDPNAEFYIQAGSTVKKKDFCNLQSVELSGFLLGVWHYIVTNIKNNQVGKTTYDQLCPSGERGSRRKYQGTLGVGKKLSLRIIVPAKNESNECVECVDEQKAEDKEQSEVFLFRRYLTSAVDYYSTKKTLINKEKPTQFYNLYVCNDITYSLSRPNGYMTRRIESPNVDLLNSISKHLIIQGTGGIGKSMLITHLFLSVAKGSDINFKIPVLVQLKDYKAENKVITQLILESVNQFDKQISLDCIIEQLSKARLILLFDGLDEIKSDLKDVFEGQLESFMKEFYRNTVIITSRPINSFVSYTKFSLCDVQPLSLEQSVRVIEKIEFWDDDAKSRFLTDLKNHLYYSHWEFASNPLLLTIMLMTHSSFGEVPGQMHVFYDQAYKTMSRLHDATKGGFKRPLYTKLTPEVFGKAFSCFCARTYWKEVLEFNSEIFCNYMDKAICELNSLQYKVPAKDYLRDLVDNLCIMYREGGKYYFIHRSFQEYFTALYFSYAYDSKLEKFGNFVESSKIRSGQDKTFDMLYEMIPEKVERFIFMPFLEKLFKGDGIDAYWDFLEKTYDQLFYEEGDVGDLCRNEPRSFLYSKIIQFKNLAVPLPTDYEWSASLRTYNIITWVEVYEDYTDESNYVFSEEGLEGVLNASSNTCIIDKDDLPRYYTDLFDDPEEVGKTYVIDIESVRKASSFSNTRRAFEDAKFPLFKEYLKVRAYYQELKDRIIRADSLDSLFDD